MTTSQKKDLLKIIVSAVLFTAGIISGKVWLLITAYILAGYETIIEAFLGIIHGQLLDENFLMTIASLGAVYCGEYPEAVAVMLFYQVGEFFEHYAVNNSRKSIAELMDIKAEYATKLVDGREVTVEPEELAIGDIIMVKPGEKTPVDGIITEGSSSLDTSALTGESVPRDVTYGQEIISGTINLTGALKVQVTRPFEDSTVAKVLDLVENAASRKASVETFITKFAHYYTPIVVGLAVILAVIPPLVIPGEIFSDWLYRAMIFLVISCPCALVISVPLSLFAGIGSASKQGILVKGSNYLEALANVNAFAFDKTGTLTTGKFTVSALLPADGVSKEELLENASHGESLSKHPVAVAVASYYENTDSSKITDFKEISGKGISAVYNGSKVFCGNRKLMNDLGFSPEDPAISGSLIHVAKDDHYLGCIVVADTIRENTAKTIEGLKMQNVQRTIMLTGDRKEIAESVAKEIGITEVLSELLPGDKVEALENLFVSGNKEENHKGNIIFVGDGINDAPVLARADVGIAMGAFGSDAAVEAADIVIMADDISKLETVTKIARKTLRICKQNVIFALIIKFGVMALGAFGLATMWEAVFADVGVSVIAILNAMRALKL